MNILITAPSLDMRQHVNGISTVVNGIIANSGHRFFHYRLGRNDNQREGIGWVWGLARQLLGFPVFLLRHRIQVVHQNFPFDAKGILRESVVTSFSRLLRVPVLLHIHGGAFLMNGCPNPVLRRLAAFMLRHSQAVIVLSEVERESLFRNYGVGNGTVLSNAVEIPAAPQSRDVPADGKLTLLFLGRMHESKGVEDLVDALRVLYPAKPFRFVACGAGPLESFFVENCRMIMGPDFEFCGIVSGAEKLAIINRAHIFVLPSRYGEGLPMALLETMAHGLVPVVTDDASMKVVVQPDTNGMRVAKRDPVDLVEKIAALLGSPELMARLSTEAQRTVRAGYGIDEYVSRLEVLYQQCLSLQSRGMA